MSLAPLILASASPRRRELLAAMGLPFEVVVSGVDETRIGADHPRTHALRVAFAKAKAVAANAADGRWILAADTVVTRNLILYDKPVSDGDARRILTSLSGQTHDVITAVALAKAGSAEVHMNSATTRVTFRMLSPEEIDAYIATGEPIDKAGAYGIQGAGGDLIERIDGDYFNVVGLPCKLVAQMIGDAIGPMVLKQPEPPARWAR